MYIIIIKNEKIRVTLCENAAGALYIVNKMCVDGQRNVQGWNKLMIMTSVLDETLIRTSWPGLTEANGSGPWCSHWEGTVAKSWPARRRDDECADKLDDVC